MARATVSTILAELKRRGSKSAREGMARYGIGDETALGVQVNVLRAMAKRIGRDHALALALWKTGVYEARMLATLVDEPEKVTLAQMDSWCRDFDTWALCDTACFSLWDQTPHAWTKVRAWAPRKEEFVRRAAFALIASLSVHDKKAPDAPFRRSLELIERYATDERNFVKKAVNWALRSVGKRNAALHRDALDVAARLAESDNRAARWNGKDALRELSGPTVRRRLDRIAAKSAR